MARISNILRSVLARSILAYAFTASVGFAQAKDLELLARVLVPAYIAHNVTIICVIENPAFLEETAGPHGHVYYFIKHVRDEVLSGLNNDQAKKVFLYANNTALKVVEDDLKEVYIGDPNTENARVRRWCEESAKPFVRENIVEHYAKHAEIEAVLERAMRD